MTEPVTLRAVRLSVLPPERDTLTFSGSVDMDWYALHGIMFADPMERAVLDMNNVGDGFLMLEQLQIIFRLHQRWKEAQP